MSRYFDGYASFDYKEMSKEKLIVELKEKVRYIGQIKREHKEEISSIQSVKDKQIKELQYQLALTEKALELACETIKSMCPRPLWIGGTIPAPEVKDAEYFKEIAKEMIDGKS